MDYSVVTLTSVPAVDALPPYQAVEVRLDLIPEWRDVEVFNIWLKENKERRIILTLRPIEGLDRKALLLSTHWPAIDYFDIELDGDESYLEFWKDNITPLNPETRIIYSCHDYEKYEEKPPFYDHYLRLKKEGDIYKYAGHGSNDILSNYRLWMKSLENLNNLNSAICIMMGSEGQFSRIKGVQLGMPWTYLSLNESGEAAPGQLTHEQWTKRKYTEDIEEVNAVIGAPILHSKSPDIFNAFYLKNNINARYSRFAMDSISELNELDLPLGYVNITAPFKKLASNAFLGTNDIAAFNYFDFRSRDLDNTDIVALTTLFDEYGSRKEKLIIIGGGGAAEGALNANANQLSAEVWVRDTNKVRALFNDYDIKVRSLSESRELSHCIVVFTVPSTVLNELNITWGENVVWIDANYKDPSRDYLDHTTCTYIPGTEWLKRQAIPVMKKQGGLLSDKEWLQVLNGHNHPQLIALIGLPGSGKSSVGKMLSEKLGWNFVDMDDFIERKAGMTIPEIFKDKGEETFRRMEVDALKELSHRSAVVVSCGGGVVKTGMARVILENRFLVLHLLVDVEEAAKRIEGSDRPLIKGRKAIEVVKELNRSRRNKYLSISDLVLNVTNRSVEQAAEKLYEEYSKSF